jgi:DNA mismatch repair protein MutL
MPIRKLHPEVASQIAAGEVVERPASVVKELLENALDAGSTLIHIRVEEAGKRLVEVADDGAGIPSDELVLAVESHATSKLFSANELTHIQSLGFRGEALASIASVSRFTITSRTTQADSGARLRVEGGNSSSIESVGAPLGTVVRVENLFYNVPARLKFLKHDTTERRQIDSLVTRYALAYPQVRFKLLQDERLALQTSGNGNRREVLANLYGVDVARQMLEVIYEEPQISVTGFISPTDLTRSNRREITFFVNGRPIQDTALTAALLKAYHTLLMVGRYPLAVLFIELPPEAVDVNVHPAKAEVRFQQPERIFLAVQQAVRRALLAYAPIPGTGVHTQEYPTQIRWTPPEKQWEEAYPQPSSTAQPLDESNTYTPLAPQQANQPGLPGQRVPLLRLIGQIANTYLVAEGPDGLYLVDQHAAHERVLFEQMMAQRSSHIPSQALLQPAMVELPTSHVRLLHDQLPLLSELGFVVETFGPHTYLIRAIPALLSGSDPAAALRVLVEDFEEDETPLGKEIEALIIARICKRAAVKGGHMLSVNEQNALLDNLEACQSPRTCPHGRPTMIHISVDLLERQFGRRGAR